MRFTCLIPTFNNGAVIRASMESVLAQSVTDLELFVVCDGAPPITHAIVDEIAARDGRVKVFKFEKGERHGEASRHRALEEATGDAVSYLSDDDCWFPDHLETIAALLGEADFAHTRQTYLHPTFEFTAVPLQITQAYVRERMLTDPFNIFGPSVAGHRLSSYRRLPEHWGPGPSDLPSDLHMWRKWLRADGVRFAASSAVTTLHIARNERIQQDPSTGTREADFWRAAMRDPMMRQALRELIPSDGTPVPCAQVAERAYELHRAQSASAAATAAELERVYASRTWRHSLPFRRLWRRIRDIAKLDR